MTRKKSGAPSSAKAKAAKAVSPAAAKASADKSFKPRRDRKAGGESNEEPAGGPREDESGDEKSPLLPATERATKYVVRASVACPPHLKHVPAKPEGFAAVEANPHAMMAEARKFVSLRMYKDEMFHHERRTAASPRMPRWCSVNGSTRDINEWTLRAAVRHFYVRAGGKFFEDRDADRCAKMTKAGHHVEFVESFADIPFEAFDALFMTDVVYHIAPAHLAAALDAGCRVISVHHRLDAPFVPVRPERPRARVQKGMKGYEWVSDEVAVKEGYFEVVRNGPADYDLVVRVEGGEQRRHPFPELCRTGRCLVGADPTWWRPSAPARRDIGPCSARLLRLDETAFSPVVRSMVGTYVTFAVETGWAAVRLYRSVADQLPPGLDYTNVAMVDHAGACFVVPDAGPISRAWCCCGVAPAELQAVPVSVADVAAVACKLGSFTTATDVIHVRATLAIGDTMGPRCGAMYAASVRCSAIALSQFAFVARRRPTIWDGLYRRWGVLGVPAIARLPVVRFVDPEPDSVMLLAQRPPHPTAPAERAFKAPCCPLFASEAEFLAACGDPEGLSLKHVQPFLNAAALLGCPGKFRVFRTSLKIADATGREHVALTSCSDAAALMHGLATRNFQKRRDEDAWATLGAALAGNRGWSEPEPIASFAGTPVTQYRVSSRCVSMPDCAAYGPLELLTLEEAYEHLPSARAKLYDARVVNEAGRDALAVVELGEAKLVPPGEFVSATVSLKTEALWLRGESGAEDPTLAAKPRLLNVVTEDAVLLAAVLSAGPAARALAWRFGPENATVVELVYHRDDQPVLLLTARLGWGLVNKARDVVQALHAAEQQGGPECFCFTADANKADITVRPARAVARLRAMLAPFKTTAGFDRSREVSYRVALGPHEFRFRGSNGLPGFSIEQDELKTGNLTGQAETGNSNTGDFEIENLHVIASALIDARVEAATVGHFVAGDDEIGVVSGRGVGRVTPAMLQANTARMASHSLEITGFGPSFNAPAEFGKFSYLSTDLLATREGPIPVLCAARMLGKINFHVGMRMTTAERHFALSSSLRARVAGVPFLEPVMAAMAELTGGITEDTPAIALWRERNAKDLHYGNNSDGVPNHLVAEARVSWCEIYGVTEAELVDGTAQFISALRAGGVASSRLVSNMLALVRKTAYQADPVAAAAAGLRE